MTLPWTNERVSRAEPYANAWNGIRPTFLGSASDSWLEYNHRHSRLLLTISDIRGVRATYRHKKRVPGTKQITGLVELTIVGWIPISIRYGVW